MSCARVFGKMILSGAAYAAGGAANAAVGASVLSDAGYAGYSVMYATRSGAAGNVLMGAAVSLLKDIYACCNESENQESEKDFYQYLGEYVLSVGVTTLGGVLGYLMLNQATEMTVGQIAAAMAVGSCTISASIVGLLCVCGLCVIACVLANRGTTLSLSDMGIRSGSISRGVNQSLSRVNGLFSSTASNDNQAVSVANQLTEVIVSNHLDRDNQSQAMTMTMASEITAQASQPVKKKEEKKTKSIEDRFIELGVTVFINNSEHPRLNKFHCPLALGPMTDPVMANDGHHYERVEIERLMGKPSPLDPSIIITTVTPDHDLRSEILEYVEGLERQFRATDGKKEVALPHHEVGPAADVPSVTAFKR